MYKFSTNHWLGLISMLFGLSASAQELHIYYDLHHDSVQYKVKGEIVEKPKLKKGGEVYLHIEEFNDYLYDIKVEMEESSAHTATSGVGSFMKMSGLIPRLDAFSGLLPNGAALGDEEDAEEGKLPILDLPIFKLNDYTVSLRNLFANSRGSAELVFQAQHTMREMSNLLDEIQVHYREIKSVEKAVRLSQFAGIHLKLLKQNPAIAPSKISARAKEYQRAIFRTVPGTDASLDALLAWEEIPSRVQSQMKKIEEKRKSFASKRAALSILSARLSAMDIEDPAYAEFINEVLGVQKKSEESEKQLEALTSSAWLQKLKNTQPGFEYMAELQMKITELKDKDFIFHTNFKTSEDIVTITIKVLKKGTGEELVKTKTFYLEATGGIKVSASAGLHFGRFIEPAQHFTTKNDLIIAEEEGLFLPAVASMLHFYSYSGSKVSIGGSIGIGMPVFNGSENQSVQFYLGPSFMIGYSERLVISLGIMGGKTNRLSKGYAKGDTFDSSLGDIPTRSRYELGCFLGTSFNLN